jgi:hypothetical protein
MTCKRQGCEGECDGTDFRSRDSLVENRTEVELILKAVRLTNGEKINNNNNKRTGREKVWRRKANDKLNSIIN